jgi:hypothetical protein
MTTRSKIEISVGILFTVGILLWNFSPCEGHGCHMDRLSPVLMTWWAGLGATALYLLWKKES